MKRKMIALFLIFAMLASLSLAVAADEMSATPTVEEILNEYHQKAFEAQTQGDTATASTWSRRSGNTKTLEQETVDTLTEAGYEAYNVTADNYETLEAELQTDFATMGLDPEGSYIVVVSVEDQSNTNSNARGSDVPSYEENLEGAGASFSYTHNGTTYLMRYLTVTSATGSNMSVFSTYNLQESMWVEEVVGDILSTMLISAVDDLVGEIVENLPLGTMASLAQGWITDDNYTELDPGTLTIHATTTWTAHSIQIWNSVLGKWITAQSSAYAISRARCVGYLPDSEGSDSEWFEGAEHCVTRYSPLYSNSAQRFEDAVLGYNSALIIYDRTRDIKFYLGDESGEILFDSEKRPLFTHAEMRSVPAYS